jgi:putative Mg2+ transporter-C (MgtC) family protein
VSDLLASYFPSTTPYAVIVAHLVGAVVAGGMIGIERSFHGRPAGFRTHTLVCLASSLLMLVTLYQSQWFPGASPDTVRTDPTRMAQGIMTGIGFLGAGVIFKEGLSVRGLTTAASIWITASIGVLIGVGFYFAATIATLLTLGTLGLFRQIELRMPSYLFAHHVLRYRRKSVAPEPEVRALMAAHGFTVANLSYRLDAGDEVFEYRMILRTRDSANLQRLSETLLSTSAVVEFRLSPTGD